MRSFKSYSEDRIPVRGGALTAWAGGEGPAVIFLHGGPGDTHHYMRRMAAPLEHRFRCIFYDQRGSGASDDFPRRAESFDLDFLLEDLVAVKKFYRLSSVALVGHSWGALHALFSCLRDPHEFSRAALVSMGPLDADMGQAVAEHLLSVLTPAEQDLWIRLRAERNAARDRGEGPALRQADDRLMQLRVKAWVFAPERRESFLSEYRQDPPPDREVNKWIWEAAASFFSWEMLTSLRVPLWVATGAQDSVPVAQAQRLTAAVPGARLRVFDRCGHLPWLEHADDFYRELTDFLLGG